MEEGIGDFGRTVVLSDGNIFEKDSGELLVNSRGFVLELPSASDGFSGLGIQGDGIINSIL